MNTAIETEQANQNGFLIVPGGITTSKVHHKTSASPTVSSREMALTTGLTAEN
jgi:hypothetical protein